MKLLKSLNREKKKTEVTSAYQQCVLNFNESLTKDLVEENQWITQGDCSIIDDSTFGKVAKFGSSGWSGVVAQNLRISIY